MLIYFKAIFLQVGSPDENASGRDSRSDEKHHRFFGGVFIEKSPFSRIIRNLKESCHLLFGRVGFDYVDHFEQRALRPVEFVKSVVYTGGEDNPVACL